METKFNLTQAQFFALNPELYSNCTNLIFGDAYCVEPVPTSPATSTSTPAVTTTLATPTSTTQTPTATSTVPANLEPGSWTKYVGCLCYADHEAQFYCSCTTYCKYYFVQTVSASSRGALDNVQSGNNCNTIETRSASHISFENTHTDVI